MSASSLHHALLALLLAAACSPVLGQIVTGRNSTQGYCRTETPTPSNTYGGSTIANCSEAALGDGRWYNVTSGHSGYSLGLVASGGAQFGRATVFASYALRILPADVPAAGGSIASVYAIGPKLGLAAVTAALLSGNLSTLAGPSTSTVILLNATFPAASNSTAAVAALDVYGNRVPVWTSTSLNSNPTNAAFTYTPAMNYSDGSGTHAWSIIKTQEYFNSTQWDTDPNNTIYVTNVVVNNFTIHTVDTILQSTSLYVDIAPPPPPPPSGALRQATLAGGMLPLVAAVTMLCMRFSSVM